MKRKLALWLTLQLQGLNVLLGQSGSPDFMRSIGKIYVVVTVIVAIFIGIVVFLVYLDRKLTKLENQIKDHD
jgi:CcmD family protein